MKRTMMLLLTLLSLQPAQAGQRPDSLLVVFWNLENFFDWKSDSRPQYWTSSRFRSKCEGVCKTLMLIADRYGQLPDVVGFAEVENRTVVSRLLRNTLLRKAGYEILHFDSPDRRGIDCALIHRPPLVLEYGAAKHLYDSSGTVMQTRDILLASFGQLCVLVNHHPSKLGSGKGAARDLAMERMRFLADSLMDAGAAAVLAVGDFNECYWEGEGTIKYNGEWEKIDGCFSFGNIVVKEEVFDHPLLLEKDKKYGGLKPRRTFTGPQYNGGLSDHLPVIFKLIWK